SGSFSMRERNGSPGVTSAISETFVLDAAMALLRRKGYNGAAVSLSTSQTFLGYEPRAPGRGWAPAETPGILTGAPFGLLGDPPSNRKTKPRSAFDNSSIELGPLYQVRGNLTVLCGGQQPHMVVFAIGLADASARSRENCISGRPQCSGPNAVQRARK